MEENGNGVLTRNVRKYGAIFKILRNVIPGFFM